MREPDLAQMNDAEFEEMLANGLSLPEISLPDDVAEQVLPWRKAMDRAIMGIALSTFSIEILYLEYILPAVGVVLAVLGFRTLRRENKWFFGCWVISLERLVSKWIRLIQGATIYSTVGFGEPIETGLGILQWALLLIVYFFLWKGLCEVQKKAGMEPHAGSAVSVMVWFLVLTALAQVNYSGLLVPAGMILLFCKWIQSLLRLPDELHEAGYMIAPAPVTMADRTVVVSLVGLLAAGMIGGYLFIHRYPMNWTPVEQASRTEVLEVKAELLALGFPEAVLADIMDEEILACRGAKRVIVDSKKEMMQGGKEFVLGEDGWEWVLIDPEMQFIGVAVELPDRHWRVFTHFEWLRKPELTRTEAICAYPAWQERAGEWIRTDGVSGRVLCDRGVQGYASPFYSVTEKEVAYTDFFGTTVITSDEYATFSFPKDGERCRGYVTYEMCENTESPLLNAWVLYAHQIQWLQYPVLTAEADMTQSSWNQTRVTWVYRHQMLVPFGS